ncbi:MAG: pilus assembly protein [Henriciella sp.]|nr:pilus assembly protein [Henriciella sp.]
MRKSWTNLIGTFRQNTNGNVAMIFGLSIVPMVAVAGFAVDFQNTTMKKNRIQVILDSAVLAAAKTKQNGGTDSEITKTVQDFVSRQSHTATSNLSCGAVQVQISTTNEDIKGEVTCQQDTSLMNVVGIDKVPFKVSSTATYGIGKVDVAFMFDVSGSMNSNSRLSSLKESAQAAVDILIPADSASQTSDVRIAMSSYNAMVDAGDYFEDVTGATPRRTYTHVIQGYDPEPQVLGDVSNQYHLGVYDADTDQLITRFGNNAVIHIDDHEWDDLNFAVTFPHGTSLRGQIESVRLNLRGPDNYSRTENAEPYAVNGDSNGNYYGERYREGNYRIRVRSYTQDRARGTKKTDEWVYFELISGEPVPDRTTSYTLTSTCVWERDGDEKFTDATPAQGSYLAYQQAWFVEDDRQSDGGDWYVGHPSKGSHSWYRGNECRDIEPLALTDNRTALTNYITGLDAGGRTAGHQGVAWSWYLVSEHWGNVFTGTGKPLDYNEPDSVKAVILMTDGSFNNQMFDAQGTSDAQARALCDNMKAKGIKVYAVAMQAPLAGQQVLSYCATNQDFYFAAESRAELIEAYEEIATSISDLRIIR